MTRSPRSKRLSITVPGAAVFLTTNPEFAPSALMHNVKHNKVLHEQNVILNIRYADVPRVPREDRVSLRSYRTPSRA